jgi:hypothetical protein
MALSEPIQDWFAYIGHIGCCQRAPAEALCWKFLLLKINALNQLKARSSLSISHRNTFNWLTQCSFNEELVLYWVGKARFWEEEE